MNRGMITLIIIIASIAAFCGFSIYAHNSVSNSHVAELKEEISNLESAKKSLQSRIGRMGQERRKLYNQLLEDFPGDENRQIIDDIFNIDTDEENDDGQSVEGEED